jgi:hypothetical protein
VAISLLFARIRITAYDISGWDMILWSSLEARSTLAESEESTT